MKQQNVRETEDGAVEKNMLDFALRYQESYILSEWIAYVCACVWI